MRTRQAATAPDLSSATDLYTQLQDFILLFNRIPSWTNSSNTSITFTTGATAPTSLGAIASDASSTQ